MLFYFYLMKKLLANTKSQSIGARGGSSILRATALGRYISHISTTAAINIELRASLSSVVHGLPNE